MVASFRILVSPGFSKGKRSRLHAGLTTSESDFTDATALGVTIAGEPLEHRLYHLRRAFSGFEHAHVVLGGESFAALAEGVQNALWVLGGTPKERRSDSLSAALRNRPGADSSVPKARRQNRSRSHSGGIDAEFATRNAATVTGGVGSLFSTQPHTLGPEESRLLYLAPSTQRLLCHERGPG